MDHGQTNKGDVKKRKEKDQGRWSVATRRGRGKKEKKRKRPRKARRWLPAPKGKVPCAFNEEFLFWFTSIWVLRDPSRLKYRLLKNLNLRGSHVRRKFRKRTTLRSKSSTLKGLLYAGWRSRCEAFVARKAALSPWSKAWARKLSSDKRQSTFIHELEILWWFPTYSPLPAKI